MYIEFQLPTGAGGMSAQYANSVINRNLNEWSERYQIEYQSKVHKWTVRVTFTDEKMYEFFALTWQPKARHLVDYIANYRFIEPMNRV